jgi:hypothetical protein
MAGGWEEVATAGSWIGTGAETGGELNKHGEAGGAAEGKYGAGEAAAVQANCIWLISGATVTLNFLKSSMPRMGPATVACKKLDVKSLPWNCSVFLMKPQEGIGCPLGCSDFHFFHNSGNVSPSLFSLGPKSSENVI